MWNERYAQPGYAYGTEPNDFLAEAHQRLPQGPVLSLGEGEGRNAVFLAQRGYDATAVDSSGVGLEKARRLAEERGVHITTLEADLADYVIEPGAWAGIVSIWCHLPPPLRESVHHRAAEGLRPGGVLLLEAYSKAQLALGTGGPKALELLYSLAELERDFQSLELVHAVEVERHVSEGKLHEGRSAVVQVIGVKR